MRREDHPARHRRADPGDEAHARAIRAGQAHDLGPGIGQKVRDPVRNGVVGRPRERGEGDEAAEDLAARGHVRA